MKGFAKYKQNLDNILENSYGDKEDFKKKPFCNYGGDEVLPTT